ncbi:MAG: hypothetical protein KDB35_23220 [Acidimicrobiales bacterium]|nr:hypothetical protein [Acidimicrobiales bacterium]
MRADSNESIVSASQVEKGGFTFEAGDVVWDAADEASVCPQPEPLRAVNFRHRTMDLCLWLPPQMGGPMGQHGGISGDDVGEVSKMAVCSQGHPVPDDQHFCGECGAVVQGSNGVGQPLEGATSRKPNVSKRAIVVAAVVALCACLVVAFLVTRSKDEPPPDVTAMAEAAFDEPVIQGSEINFPAAFVDGDETGAQVTINSMEAEEPLRGLLEDLGFSSSVADRVLNTSSADGQQTAEGDQVTVSWQTEVSQNLLGGDDYVSVELYFEVED